MNKTLNIESFFETFCLNENLKQINGCSIIPSKENLLFNIAGITNAELEPFLSREKETNDTFFSIQQCIRTEDIEEIGDDTHLTSFKMLGIFSFLEISPSRIINLIWKFIVQCVPKNSLIIKINEKDDLAFDIWKTLLPEEKIVKLDKQQNEWFISEKQGVRGFGSEIFFVSEGKEDLELVNIVVMNKNKLENGEIIDFPLTIDVGMGLERIQQIHEQADNIYTSLYQQKLLSSFDIKQQRIIADHLTTCEIMFQNGIRPGAKKREFIFKKLIRIVVKTVNLLESKKNFLLLTEITNLDIQNIIIAEITLMKKSLRLGIKY